MLSLAEHVGSHCSLVGFSICNDQDFARPRNHIYGYYSRHFLLCFRHIDVSRSNYLICLWNRFGSIGQGGYGLGTTYTEHSVHTCNIGCGQHSRIYFPILSWRRHHYNTFAPGNLGRNSVHKHSRRIGCGSSGDINTGHSHRNDLLSQHNSILFRHHKAVSHLSPVVLTDILCSLFQNSHKLAVHGSCSFLNLFSGNLYSIDNCAVKLRCIFLKGLVSPFLDILEYLGYHIRHIPGG